MQHRCTCPDAELASYRYFARWRAGIQPVAWLDATGTNRRLQALAAIGWSAGALGQRLGCSSQAVCKLRRQQRVHRDTVARVAALYADLACQPAPAGESSKQARAAARKQGWARPEHWADADIDDPAAVSDLAYQRHGDTAAGADALWLASPEGGGLDDRQIAGRLNVGVDQVKGWRRAAGIAAGVTDLTDDEIYAVRERWIAEQAAGRLDRRQLAADFGLTTDTLQRIASGRARGYLGLTDLINAPQLTNQPRQTGSPTRDTRPVTALADRNRTRHNPVTTARPTADTTSTSRTLTNPGEPRQRSA